MRINQIRKKHIAPVVLAIASTFAVSNASAITIGTYKLSNHPDGGIADPLYGLRLDDLLEDDTKYTFDFDHTDSNMRLTWDGTKIVISGEAFGGEDIGTSYGAGTTAVWDIYFEYTVGITQPGGDGGLDDLFVNADNQNFGTISSSLGSFELEDQSSSGLSFQFGDEGSGGHRGFDGISGWGWMNHGTNCVNGDCTHAYHSDWLFTASPVPVPAAVYLFGTGLLGLIGVARRRRA